MADSVPVVTQRSFPREFLRQAFGDNPRMIKAFEGLLTDVSTTLPESIIDMNIDQSVQIAQRAFAAAKQPAAAALMSPDASTILAVQIFGA